MLVNARSWEFWAKIDGFVRRFDPGWCITLLYDHTAVLSDEIDGTGEGLALYPHEVAVARRLHDVWDPMVRKYDEHDDEGHLTDPRWSEVEEAAAELLRVMRKSDEESGLTRYLAQQ
ncbi:hypothetical protein [Gordonia malaquae]|uniref:hypothetical protein n=1 Tax=Gordonia malaquae TaxID=410332 RepID=UPI0030FE4C8A